jgi:tetratricopeptide (TPR) repeat protein
VGRNVKSEILLKLKKFALLSIVWCTLAACSNTSQQGGAAAGAAAPESPAAMALRAHKLMEANDMPGALTLLDEVLKLEPKHARALFDRAMVRMSRQDLDGALSDVELAAQLAPGDARVLGAQCLIRVAAGQVDSGLTVCQAALAAGKNGQSNALTSRGQAYLLLGRHVDALADFEQALSIAPNHMRAMFGRGLARQALGERSAGQIDLDLAVARLPGAGREFVTKRKD